jgi:chromosome segregation ATPase
VSHHSKAGPKEVKTPADLVRVEAEFETGLRAVEARCERRLQDAEKLRSKLEEELAEERNRAEGQERELQRLRKEAKQLGEESASAEARLKAFEQMLEAVEDGIDERIGKVEERTLARISEAEELRRILEASIGALTAEKQTLKREVEQEQARSRELVEQVESSVSRIDALSADKDDLLQKLAQAKREAENAARLMLENERLRQDVDELRARLDQIKATWSWRFTAPLRRMSHAQSNE